MTLDEKYSHLKQYISRLGRAATAFSGGVDSALLAYVSSETLGSDAFAVTLWSPLLSLKDREDIFEFTERFDISLIRIDINECEDEAFAKNCGERCYICKSMRIKKLLKCAEEWNIPWILDGSNIDDMSDYRPGMRALKECSSVLSPLLECGFTKKDIRQMSERLGLPTAEKPAAACLASRIPTGVRIDREKINTVGTGEEILRQYFPHNARIRLRYDGALAKIETDTEFIPILETGFADIKRELGNIGIKELIIDKEGYRMGSVTKRT